MKHMFAIRCTDTGEILVGPEATSRGVKIAHSRGVKSGKYTKTEGLELVRYDLVDGVVRPYTCPVDGPEAK